MAGLDFLFSPNSQFYNARQTMINDNLKNEQQSLANQTTEAGLPGVMGRSQSLAAQGQYDQATLDDKIKQAGAEHLQKMDEMQLKELSGFGEKMGQIGSFLENVPPPLRGAEFERMRNQYRLPQIPGFEQLGAEQLPAALSKMGQGMMLMSKDALSKRQLKEMDVAGQLEGDKIRARATVDAAGVRADASMQNAVTVAEAKIEATRIAAEKAIQVAQVKAAAAETQMKVNEQIAALVTSEDFKTNPVKQQKYRDLMATFTQLKAAGANTLNSELVGGKPVTTPQERSSAVASEVAPLPAPNTPAPQEDAPDTLAYYKKLYAGKNVTNEQIRSAYKKKTGKDLK
jgi:hypothetical protein